jgi:hypothetical protein
MRGVDQSSAESVRRSHWVVDRDIVERDEARQVCSALLHIVRPAAVRVDIDAITDYPDLLSDVARDAQERLREMGRQHSSRGDPNMAVESDPQRPDHWDLIQVYAPWSIHVTVWAAPNLGRHPLATLHDCGSSITGYLTDGQAAEFARRVGAIRPVVRNERKRLLDRVRHFVTGREPT